MEDFALTELVPRLQQALVAAPGLVENSDAAASVALELTGIVVSREDFGDLAVSRGVIRIHAGDSRRVSTTQVRNLFVDVGRLLSALSSSALDTFAAVAQPWLLPLVVVKVIGEWKNAATLELSPTAAALIWVLWSEGTAVSQARLEQLAREELVRRGEAAAPETIEYALSQLIRSGCVAVVSESAESRELSLIQRVQVSLD